MIIEVVFFKNGRFSSIEHYPILIRTEIFITAQKFFDCMKLLERSSSIRELEHKFPFGSTVCYGDSYLDIVF